eukprot:TRINITY_DN12162_c0_g1_i1.p1 TRINITY_DN12162_c0_g1~~TRINITY_DN12162_c0_g1_i1.p1  ORF type:complete len:550 (+),score=168.37 TRINITY_DN12162_c0_g1_i1:96-1652(+)
MALRGAALLAAAAHALGLPHPKCESLSTYQAPYVASEYNMTRHMGHYYEVAFRDLYLGYPTCDCQHSYKVADGAGSYHEDFEQKCKGLGRMASVLALNATGAGPGQNAQSFAWSHPQPPIPGLDKVRFHTVVAAFKAVPGQLQYEWVVEFTCGEDPQGALAVLFPGGFVGLNLYSRTGPTSAANLAEMRQAVTELGIGWAMDSWGWGFHVVPHNSSCEYNPPSRQEYACRQGACVPVRWGAGTGQAECEAACGKAAAAAAAGPIDMKCTIAHCSKTSERCFLERTCRAGLECAQGCMKQWDSDPSPQKLTVQNCSNACVTSYADARYVEYMNCMTTHNCLNFPAINDSCPAPKPAAALSVADMEGDWWAVAGLHPLYDCYGCDRWSVRRLNDTTWVADISYASQAVNGTVLTETVHWPVPQAPPGQPIAGFCQGCFVKGMPHGETWYLLDKDPAGAWIALNYCGSTLAWHYHGALVLAKGELDAVAEQRLRATFRASVNASFPADFCLPRHGAACASA